MSSARLRPGVSGRANQPGNSFGFSGLISIGFSYQGHQLLFRTGKTKAINTLVHASNVVSDRVDCAHPRTRVKILPPGQSHYARVVCEDCGQQLCYRPSPTNAERRRLNAINIQKLLGSNCLTEWEAGYCQGLQHNPRPTTRQQALLDELVSKYILEKENTTNAVTNRNGAPRYECAAQ